MSTKPTNPKDLVGSSKLQLELVPDTIEAELSLAFLEGALKYGRYNWRIAGVRSSVYYAAMKRHQKKWWNGENADKSTRVKHLTSVMACCGILLDAELCGKLEDDRPPYAPISDLMDSPEMLAQIAHLKELFAGHTPAPKQYVLADGPAPSAPGARLPEPVPEILTSAQARAINDEVCRQDNLRQLREDLIKTRQPISPAAQPGFPVTPGRYRTRQGGLVTIDRILPEDLYPAKDITGLSWTLDGARSRILKGAPWDLVERLPDEPST